MGSNLNDRADHLAHGLRGLRAAGELLAVSSVYETPPEGYTAQPPFLNLVAHLETALGPRALLERARALERAAGRVRSFRNAPRTLDIDILLYDDLVRDLEGLVIPHPRMVGRVFVLVPLLELAPGAVDARTGRPYADWLADLVARRRAVDPEEISDPGELSGLGIRRVMDGEELLGGDAT